MTTHLSNLNLLALAAGVVIGPSGCAHDELTPAIRQLAARVRAQGPAVNLDAQPTEATRVGILWWGLRPLPGSIAEPPPPGHSAHLGPLEIDLMVQEVAVSGSFPDDFVLELDRGPSRPGTNRNEPSLDDSVEDDQYSNVSMGSLVLLRADAAVGTPLLTRDPRVINVVGVDLDYGVYGLAPPSPWSVGFLGEMPRLTRDMLDTLGIVSQPPVLVVHNQQPTHVFPFSYSYPAQDPGSSMPPSPDDYGVPGDAAAESASADWEIHGLLAPGYHLATYDGAAWNDQREFQDCSFIDHPDVNWPDLAEFCGEYPRVTVSEILDAESRLTIVPGGTDDLARTPLR